MNTSIEKNSRFYFQSAKRLLLPVTEHAELLGFNLVLGKHHYIFHRFDTPFNDASSTHLSMNKFTTNRYLEQHNIPVPKGILLSLDAFKQSRHHSSIEHLRYPLVVKPVFGARGIDVLCNIQTPEELEQGLIAFFAHYPQVIIEEFHGKLKSYRVLIFKQKILGIVLRHPATITGDGEHTIAQLIAQSNEQRKAITEILGPIVIDQECLMKFKEYGVDEQYIPRKNERLILNYTSNAHRGGTYETVSNNICRENRRLLRQITRLLNLPLAGIDVECADLSRPLNRSNGVIIEVNCKPNVEIHEQPLAGNKQMVTRSMMRYFIYRHPLLYIKALYRARQLAVYAKSSIALMLFALVYLLVMR